MCLIRTSCHPLPRQSPSLAPLAAAASRRSPWLSRTAPTAASVRDIECLAGHGSPLTIIFPLVVRDASKLRKLLAGLSIPESLQDSHLTITVGDVKDPAAVTRALKPTATGPAVRTIIDGVGSVDLALNWNPLLPIVCKDPTICEDAAATILDAVGGLGLPAEPAERPLLVCMSTTGVAGPGRPRDVPLLFTPLYHWLLASPHADKRNMEALVDRAAAKRQGGVLRSAVVVRPSLLTDGKGEGAAKLRVGWEAEAEADAAADGKVVAAARPAVGYTVARRDVGAWMFEEFVKKDGDGWAGKKVTLTS